MKPRYLVLDLETVLDTFLPPPKKKADGSDAFPHAPYHRIAVMGAALFDAQHVLRRLWIVGEDGDKDERGTLASLAAYLDAHRDLTIVSWNGRGFDLPVIVARCLRHGVPFPWYFQRRDARYRYSAEGHFDLMDYLADHGAAKSYSLDVAAKLVGLPGKLDTKGSDVQAMIDEGRLDDVRAYCLSDVAQTAALFLRVQFLRGEVDAATCAHALRVLLATMAGEPRLAPVLPRVDRDRLIPGGDAAPLPLQRAA
jgi:predicted PolB exonuclease-like 3'-5' exonuclease